MANSVNPPIIHYSAEPLLRVSSVKQSPTPETKPNGLWISIEDGYGWADWCRMELFALERLRCATTIKLTGKRNVLWIKSARGLDAFQYEYGLDLDGKATRVSPRFIDWPRVAQKHGGIIVAPYIRQRRFDGARWYWGWDCSSGCIWDRRAITKGEHKIAALEGK